jgi:2-methylisocitrate lyase-like PEP mutase family enzyme
MRSVRMLERSGASGIQLEDQTYPKRCGHLRGKTLVSTGEMAGKIQAAVDARRLDTTLIIGRTDAIAVEGTEQAIERAYAYYEAGADIVFIESIRTTTDIEKIMAVFGHRVPVMANMVEGGDTPLQDATSLQQQGFSLVIFPGALVRAFTYMAMQFFDTLKQNGTTDPFRNNMLNFTQLNDYLGTAKMLELGQKYEGKQ